VKFCMETDREHIYRFYMKHFVMLKIINIVKNANLRDYI
jgi:hypothetical protein